MNEFTYDITPGLTLFGLRYTLAGLVFRIASPQVAEIWGTDGRTAEHYAVTMTETTIGVSGHYVGNFDNVPDIGAGRYKTAIATQAGGSPANSDLPAIAYGEIEWNGSTEIYHADEAALATHHGLLGTHVNTLVSHDLNMRNVVDPIKVVTDLLDGMIIEDSAGNQFTIAALQNAPTAEMDADELAIAMKAITGITEGGTWTWEKIMKIMTAWTAGNWRVKATDSNTQELLDAEDGTTVILEQTLTRSPSAGNDYRKITVKI